MQSNHHRTWQRHEVGHFHITVELDPVADGRSFERHPRLAEVTASLVKLLDAHRLPATWGVGDPAHSPASSLVLRSPVDHELAILGDPSWLGPTAGRTRFARELARRVAQARALGVAATTLVPRAASIERHTDLVIKQGITAVAGLALNTTGHSLAACTPRALHYGVWELPVTGRLPVTASWWFGGGWVLGRRMRAAAYDASAFHLLIDAPAVERDGLDAERLISRLAGRIAALRDRGLIQVETLAAASARLSDVPAAVPQRSILHRAA